jgi:biotin synthase
MHLEIFQPLWTLDKVLELYHLPFFTLMEKARSIHKENFNDHQIQASTLLSIKTGGCKEDCAYCPQSSKYKTGIEASKMMSVDDVLEKAKAAKEAGATRFCMGAAWRSPTNKGVQDVCQMVKAIKNLGLETCATLGMIDKDQAEQLKEAGLDFYNHNIDTSEEYYPKIISTRTFQDRLNTLENAREAGMKICCGGIIGMGETVEDRLKMLIALANLSSPPESIPINQLIPIPGTPLAESAKVDAFEFIKIIAIARILMPSSYVRLSAGREHMDDSLQAWAFFAGANSIFFGDVLLTAKNPSMEKDKDLLTRLSLTLEGTSENNCHL